MNGISVKNLSVTFSLPSGPVEAVRDVSLTIPPGTITGLVGESGCGKSVLGMALLGLLPPYAQVTGTMELGGTPLPRRELLGRHIGLVPQSPSQSLNPARRVRAHLLEALLPLNLPRREAEGRAADLLKEFGFPEPGPILRAYPHQLSGGMQQRVLCALGAACSPEWVVADEPTKGLDRPLRDQVAGQLALLHRRGASLLLITHDLELAARVCGNIAVMYRGQVMEWGPETLNHPAHPYTRSLLAALPQNGFQAPELGMEEPGAGCPFCSRCPQRLTACETALPPEVPAPMGQKVRCFRYG